MDVSGLTIKADRPDGSLLTVDGPEQMVGKLRSLRFGLWEGHRRTCVDKPTVNTVTLILPSRVTIKQMLSFTLKLYCTLVHYIWFTKYVQHKQYTLFLR